MKIRTDFVTNSSSSSFVVEQCGEIPDVFTLAERMIEFRGFDNDKILIERIRNCDFDRDTSVIFNTCNYETFIFKDQNKFLVDTCNNHPWSDILRCLDVKYVEDIGLCEKIEEIFFIVELNKTVRIIDKPCRFHGYRKTMEVIGNDGNVITETCVSCTYQ